MYTGKLSKHSKCPKVQETPRTSKRIKRSSFFRYQTDYTFLIDIYRTGYVSAFHFLLEIGITFE